MNSLARLLGDIIISIDVTDTDVRMTTMLGWHVHMYHDQDCCESVYLQDVVGDVADLLDSPLLVSEEISSEDAESPYDDDDYEDSYTWTFYKFATIKGSVTMRWLGTSNGYYSESVTVDINKGEREFDEY